MQSKQISFKGQSIFIGIDVHLNSWTVSVLSATQTLKTFSQIPNPQALFNYLSTNYPEASYYSVYEAGFCGFWTHYELISLGINNIIVNPADVPTTIGEKIRKTDAVDSCKLAKSLRAGVLKSIYIPDKEVLEVRNLIRLRFSLTKDLTRQKNRIKSFLYFHGIEIPKEYCGTSCWSKRFVDWLKTIAMSSIYGKQSIDILIDQLENLRLQKLDMIKKLRDLARSEKYSKSVEVITSVPGIGLLTGLSILAEIDDVTRFKNSDQLASYIGIVPMCYSSGEHENVGDITMRKHEKLRSLLIEASWIAIRHDPAMTFAYEEYRKRMVGSKAVVKIARRLVNRIYYVMKNNVMYKNSTI